MAIRHGRALWPGVETMISCTYTVSHGISPGVAVLTCAPQAGEPAAAGDLVILDGELSLTLRGCKLDRLDVTRDGGGIRWNLVILDRRWRWRGLGAIAGCYNQTDPHGLLIPWTVRTSRQLAELCLLAMGERNYAVAVPDVVTPPVNWDYEPPAQALARLAESLGCRVVYQPAADAVLVAPAGVGRDLPDGSVQSEGPSLDTPERPDSIVLVGAPMRFQGRFRLQAVGKDWDGHYRPLDALSYAPTTGRVLRGDLRVDWTTVPPPSFAGLQGTDRLTRLEAIELAKSSVYRCYQLVNLDPAAGERDKPLEVPGYGRILRREQVLLEETKVEQVQPEDFGEGIQGLFFDADGQKLIKHFYDGYRRDRPAECFGSYDVGRLIRNDGPENNTAPTKKIAVGFSIDPYYQVITFNEYVYLTDRADGKIKPAEPVLEAACTVRDPVTNQVVRYARELKFGEPRFGTPPAYVFHDDVQANFVGLYVTSVIGETRADHKLRGLAVLSGQGFGIAETLLRANHYLACEARKYQFVGGLTRTYNGLMPITPDGAVQQVTWSVGAPGGATTQASRNTEHSVYVPPFGTRLRQEFAPAPERRADADDVAPGFGKQPLPGVLAQGLLGRILS